MFRRLAVPAIALAMGVLVLPIAAFPQESHDVRIFAGGPRLLIVHGYSTSQHLWAFLQRKIDRYMGGADTRVVEVQLCNKGGTPISRWMNIETGQRSEAWKVMLTPMIQAEKGRRPVIVLCQQSLQGAYPPNFADGIRNADDAKRIARGADALRQYGEAILVDGAAAVVIGMHIFKRGMEPQIGNERLALAALMKRKPAGIFAGPDTWEPTSKQHPLAFDTDRLHPNFIGAEMMAHYWFEALLKREGLEVPAWSRQEMEDAIKNKPLGLTRNRDLFRKKLKEWKIVNRKPPVPSRRSQRTQDRGQSSMSKRVLQRYDKDGDGKLNDKERAAFEKARAARRRKTSNRALNNAGRLVESS